MAMNKKEKQLLEDYKIKTSLHISTGEKPLPDVAPPVSFSGVLSTGYLYNCHAGQVVDACSSSVSHGYGRNDKTSSQKPRWLYSTKVLAAKAMRFDMELEFAKKLYAVDCEIEK